MEVECPRCHRKLEAADNASSVLCPHCKTLKTLHADPSASAPKLVIESDSQPVPVAAPALPDSSSAPSAPKTGPVAIVKPRKPQVIIAAAGIGALAVLVIIFVAVRSVRYRMSMDHVKRRIMDMTADNAIRGVAASRYVIGRTKNSSPDYQDAMLALGVYLFHAGDLENAYEQLKNGCMAADIHPVEAGVFAARSRLKQGRYRDAGIIISEVIDRIDALEIRDRIGAIGAETYCEIAVRDESMDLMMRFDRVKWYRDAFPGSMTIRDAFDSLRRTADEYKNSQLQAIADRYAAGLGALVNELRRGMALAEDGTLAEAHTVLVKALEQLPEYPVDTDGVFSDEEREFRESYEACMLRHPDFGRTIDYLDLCSLIEKARMTVAALPGMLLEKGYVLQAGVWSRRTPDADEEDDAALPLVAERIDLSGIVTDELEKEIKRLSVLPATVEVVRIVMNDSRQTAYEGPVESEDDDTLTIRTLFGPVKLNKTEIAKREGGSSPTRDAQLLGMLQAALKASNLHEQLADAADFALKNRLTDSMNLLFRCCLYLQPADARILRQLKLISYCAVECPRCSGTGKSVGNRQTICPRCVARKPRLVCGICGGTGNAVCPTCTKGYIKRGQREIGCPTCGSKGTVTCSTCRGTGTLATSAERNCATCWGAGYIWSMVPGPCPDCQGEKVVFDAEYLSNPYQYLLRFK